MITIENKLASSKFIIFAFWGSAVPNAYRRFEFGNGRNARRLIWPAMRGFEAKNISAVS
jgi:hypothetical protein